MRFATVIVVGVIIGLLVGDRIRAADAEVCPAPIVKETFCVSNRFGVLSCNGGREIAR